LFAAKLKEYRLSVGLTQQEFAETLGVAQNTISQYESGKRTPTVRKLVALSSILGCSVSELTCTDGAETHE